MPLVLKQEDFLVLIVFDKFPVFSLSGKKDFQIPCFPCAVETLFLDILR